jgi:hypothetical protein
MMDKNNNLVVQSNKLIEAKYRLSAMEQKLLSIMIGDISPEDKDFKEYSYKVSDIVDWLALEHKGMYSEIEKLTARLIGRIISIRTDNELFQTSWLSSAKYIKDIGVVKLKFDPGLKPYLLQLKSCFTQYALGDFLSLKSKYAMRIYELLKQYLKIGNRKFHLKELRETLGLKETELSRWSDFKRIVLEISKREINNKTDIRISYTTEKLGRKIEFIIFSIKKKVEKQEISSEISQDLEGLFSLVPEKYRNLKTLRSGIEKYFEKEGIEYTKRNIQYANTKSKTNYRTFLLKSLKEDWGLDWEETQASQAGSGIDIQALRDQYAGQWTNQDGSVCNVVVNSTGQILANGQQIEPQILEGWKRI